MHAATRIENGHSVMELKPLCSCLILGKDDIWPEWPTANNISEGTFSIRMPWVHAKITYICNIAGSLQITLLNMGIC